MWKQMGQHSSGAMERYGTWLGVASTHRLRKGKQRDVGTGGSAIQWGDGTLQDFGWAWRLLTPCEKASKEKNEKVGQYSSGAIER